MEQEELLGEAVTAAQVGEPLGDPVDLVGGGLADVTQMRFAWGEAPLRVEREPDMWLGQEFLVAHRLGEEVGVSWLQVENHVEPRRRSGVDPRTDVVDRALQRVVPIGAGLRRRDRRDDLEGGDHGILADALVAGGDVARPLHGGIHRLFPEDTEVVVAGVAVDGHETPTGKQQLAAAGKLRRRRWRTRGGRRERRGRRGDCVGVHLAGDDRSGHGGRDRQRRGDHGSVDGGRRRTRSTFAHQRDGTAQPHVVRRRGVCGALHP